MDIKTSRYINQTDIAMKNHYKISIRLLVLIGILLFSGQNYTFSQTDETISTDPAEHFDPNWPYLSETPGFFTYRDALTSSEMHILDTLTNAERQLIEEAYDPIAIGVVRDLTQPIILNLGYADIPEQGETSKFGGRLVRINSDTLVYTTYIQSTKANELRVFFEYGYFPYGVRVNLFSGERYAFTQTELWGELSEYGFYTTSVDDDHVYIQVVMPIFSIREGIHFKISRITHVDHRYLDEESYRWCTEDANCSYAAGYSNIAALRRATARLSWPKGGGYVGLCSGSLVNDSRPQDFQPFLLTANHCFDTQAEAVTVEARFDYWSTSCNSGVVNPGHFIVNGTNLIVTNPQTDVTFLLLKRNPGGLRNYLGWNLNDVANNATLHTTNHPNGTLTKYSRHQNKTSPSWTCDGRPTTRYLYTKCIGGRTAGGSSGGPIVNANNQLVGQLLGKCWHPSGWDHCNYDHFYNVWGKFSVSYANNNLQYWLNTTLGGFGVAMSTSPAASYNYGTVNLGSSKNLTVTVTNTGTRPNYLNLEAGNATISGTNANQFSITSPTSLYLAPGESGTFTVRFTPTTGGAKSAQLNIPHNADNITSPRVITLNGTGGGTAGLWTGAINADWHTSGNWSNNIVPNSTTDVSISGSAIRQPVISSWAVCRDLVLQNGATLNHNSSYLDVYGTFDPAFGQYTMTGTAELWFMGSGNVSWWNDLGNDVYTSVTIWKASADDIVTMTHSINCSGTFNISRGKLQMNNSRTLTVNATSANAFQVGNGGTLILSSGRTLTVAGGIRFNDGSQASVTGGIINCGGNFNVQNNTLYDIKLTGVTLRMNGSANQSIQDFDAGTELHHLSIDKSGGTLFLAQRNLIVNGNLTILNGMFSANNAPTPTATYDIYIKGNWTNHNFPAGFIPGSGKVFFNGPGHQYVYSSENFNVLVANMVAALRITEEAHTVTCNQYQWISGGIDVFAGTFTANDLAQSGLYGGFWVNPGGTINITNITGSPWVDLHGSVNILGGTMNLTGTFADWPYANGANFTMTGGLLDIKSSNFRIMSAYSWTNSITGGTIKLARGFTSHRADFTPAHGIFEFYGSTDGSISQAAGSSLNNVVINKIAGKEGDGESSTPIYDKLTGELICKGDRANTITLNSNMLTTGDLTIQAGSFNLGSHTCNVAGTTTVFGQLIMNNAANDLTTGYMLWDDGSSANVTAGTFHAGTWFFKEGTTAKLGTGNTAYVTSSMNIPTSNDAEFGNLVRGPLSKNISGNESGKAFYPTKVMGYYTVKSGASLVFWEPGAGMIVAGNATIENGASISFSAADFQVGGTLNLSGTLSISNGRTATIEGELIFPASGWLFLNNASFINNYNAASGLTVLSGRLTMNSGSLLEFPGRSISLGAPFVNEISGGTIRFGRTFNSTVAGTFQQNIGTIEFISTNSGHYINLTNGNYANNIKVNKPSTPLSVTADLTLKGSLTIDAGALISNHQTIQIGGDWTNNVGAAAFVEGTGRVIFNGTGSQSCNSETFHILEVNKASGTMNFPGTTVCAIYDWSAGGITVNGGTFTANDLHDNGLFGSYTVNNGTINLHQSADQYIDFAGDITIGNGGVLNVYGGVERSYWPYFNDASLTMSGNAILDIKDQGIFVNNTYAFTANITGGTIRTSGGFESQRADFAPNAGTFMFYGSDDAFLFQSNGSTLYNVVIYKSAKGDDGSKSGKPVYDHRSGTMISDGSKANTILLGSNFNITRNLTVESGALTLNEKTLTVNRDCIIYGTLNMTNAADVLNVGTVGFDRLAFPSGSTANVTNGTINCYGWIIPHAGSSFNLGADNTVYIKGTDGGGLSSFEPSATYGNVVIAKNAGNFAVIDAAATEPIIVNGNFTMSPDNVFRTQYNRMTVHGIFTDATTSTVYVLDLAKKQGLVGSSSQEPVFNEPDRSDYYLEIDTDFTLNGSLVINNNGKVYVHGRFSSAAGSSITINNGSFIADSPNHPDKGWEYLNGNLTMTSGLFEITHNSTNFGSTATTIISGGIIRSGGAFYATDPGVFQPIGGVVEITGDNPDGAIYCYNGNHFYNLDINRSGGYSLFRWSDPVFIQNNLTINSGKISSGNCVINVEGNVMVNSGGTLELTGPGGLKMGNLGTVTVNSGGTLAISGSEMSQSLISRISTGYYTFNIESGGMVSANNAVFEYMNEAGIHIKPEAIVDETNSFHNCTFRNGESGGSLLTINSDQVFSVHHAEFPENTWGGLYNVSKTENSGQVEFKYYTGDFAGSEFENDTYDRIDWFEPLLTADPLIRNVTPPAGETTFGIISNLIWTVTESVDWLEVSHTWGSNNETITVTYEANTSQDDRTGYITLSADHAPDVTLTVIQSGVSLSVFPPSRDVGAAAGVTNFFVTSNTTWTVSESVSWLTVAPMSGSGNAQLTVTYDENTSVTPRSGAITVSADGVADVTMMVHQAGAAPILAVTPAMQEVGAPAGTTTFDVESNTAWTVTEELAWLTVAPMAGSGDASLMVTYDENTHVTPRSGAITLSADGVANAMVEVHQAGAAPLLSVTPASQEVDASAGTTTFDVESNTAWTVTEELAWLTVAPMSGGGDASLMVTYDENTHVTPRSGAITVSADGVADVTVMLHQAGAASEIPIERLVTNETIHDGFSACYDAWQQIVVQNFIVEHGGAVTLIAGESIVMLPGTHAKAGSYLHARITATGEFCGSMTGILATKEPVNIIKSEETDLSVQVPNAGKDIVFFRVYPNPTSGIFTLELADEVDGRTCSVEIFTLVGERVFSEKIMDGTKHQFNLTFRPKGIYFVRVTFDGRIGIEKLVKH